MTGQIEAGQAGACQVGGAPPVKRRGAYGGAGSGGGYNRAAPGGIDEIKVGLASEIDRLCREILPAGRKEGPEWCVGSLAGEPGRSLKVHLTGARQGIWRDFAGDMGGDVLDLVCRVVCAGNIADTLKWSRQWLGLEAVDRADFERRRKQREATAAAVVKQQEVDDQRTQDGVFRLWMAARKDIIGSPVDVYLRGRGIRLDHLRHEPSALRYHPAVWCAEVQRELPCMVSAIMRYGQPRPLVAVHRTYLDIRGDGSVVKAALADAKKSWGSFAGGGIPLSRGKSGKVLALAPASDIVALSEGIEDGLTVALANPDLRVICAVSLGNMANLRLPPQIHEILIAGQNDPAGSAAAKVLANVVDKFTREGRRVRLARPPEGVKDFNDLVKGAALVPQQDLTTGKE